MTSNSDSGVAIGVTQRLLTTALERELARHGDDVTPLVVQIDDAEVPERLSRHVGALVARHLAGLKDEGRVEAVRRILEVIGEPEEAPVGKPSEVLAVTPNRAVIDESYVTTRPQTPLNDAALLTNARHDPSLASEIRAELASADSVDLLCAFVKWSGLRLLDEELRAFKRRGGRFRVITTTYIGATERAALDRLVRDFGAEVKIQYDVERTRLHAKSWYFHRASGWNTAYVGSSNLSVPAMLDGVEWNVRLSKQQTGSLLTKFERTFESYWNDPSYIDYDPERDAAKVDAALDRGAHRGRTDGEVASVSGLDVEPYPHQVKVLEQLEVERTLHGRHRNLIVAATGTGKTVIAAFDYRNAVRANAGLQPTFLFLAHREEILDHARATFRAVLKEGSFGEKYVNGFKPMHWNHVFATVQTLSQHLDQFDPTQFSMIVVDEFHHAEAASYRRILDYFEPAELVGMTATPERTDGVNVRDEFFDGHTAAEIRLWDALEADLLTPFHYFAISDNTDLRSLTWSRGRYDDRELTQLYVNNRARSGLILEQVQQKILNPRQMRALGFCVSVQHAAYMAEVFTDAGLPAIAVTGQSPDVVREDALVRLGRHELAAIFTVDLYNEGVDLPEIDTVLFLRPTESATIFLQQLGRGLRKAADKAVLTALDFVGLQNTKFKFEAKYRALTGASRRALDDGVRHGFSYLPPGTEIELDEASQQAVLANLKEQISPKRKTVVAELRTMVERSGRPTLVRLLEETQWDLAVVLKNAKWSWFDVQRDAGVITVEEGPRHRDIIHRARALACVDDPERLRIYRAALDGSLQPYESLTPEEQMLVRMLAFSIWPSGGGFATVEEALAALREEPGACLEFLDVLDVAESQIERVSVPIAGRLGSEVLRTHAHYTREEIVVGMHYAGFDRRPDSLREGVFFSEALQTDVFLVTLKKNEKNYSPTTMYHDVAISPEVFHWESQSTTAVDSPVGQRYIHHRERGSEVLLFVRDEKRSDLGTAAPYLCLGTVDYLRHEGSRPIEFDWELRAPIPAQIFATMRTA